MKKDLDLEEIKKIKEPIAIILGRYTTTGLAVSRCLGRKDIPVIWLDPNSDSIGFYSKYCKCILCQNPKYEESKYLKLLLKIGKNLQQKAVLIPIFDTEVLVIAKNQKKLSKYFHINYCNFDVAEKIIDKEYFYKTLEKYDIPHPKTFYPKNLEDIKKICKKITFPCFIKPVVSSDFVLEFRIKLFRVESKDELIDVYNKKNLQDHKVMIQEIIPGNARYMYGFNTYYDKNSESKKSFMYRRIREWPYYFGNGCYIEKIEIPEMEKTVSTLVKKMGYYGIVDAEFKKDPRDGLFKLVEINPRCWMQISFPERYGLNLAYIVYMKALGKKVDINLDKEAKIKWTFSFHDFLAAFYNIKNQEITIFQWLKSLKGRKQHAIFAWDDPLPFLMFIFKVVRFNIIFFYLWKYKSK